MDSGDQTMFDFYTHAVDPGTVVFEVNWHIAPLPYWEWITPQYAGAKKLTNNSGAMVTGRVMPPPEAAHRPPKGSRLSASGGRSRTKGVTKSAAGPWKGPCGRR